MIILRVVVRGAHETPVRAPKARPYSFCYVCFDVMVYQSYDGTHIPWSNYCKSRLYKRLCPSVGPSRKVKKRTIPLKHVFVCEE